jgi:cell division septation protein DedD
MYEETMKKYIFPVSYIFLTLVFSLAGFSQTKDEEVAKIVRMIDRGDIENAKTESSNLITAYPNEPGVLYLQGRLASDGVEAVKFYQTILNNFPKSQWADDALYHSYQYYYALGLYRTANLKLNQLKKEYPSSPYLSAQIPEELKVIKEEEKPVNIPPVVAEEKTITPPTVDRPKLEQSYTIQVGAFSTLKNAEKQKHFFEDWGYQVEITNKVRSGKSLYLVWVGNFRTAEEAVKSGYEIKQKYNIETITVQKY